jgi:hypothetical protein
MCPPLSVLLHRVVERYGGQIFFVDFYKKICYNKYMIRKRYEKRLTVLSLEKTK